MSKRVDILLLKDIVESCDKIFRYTQNLSFSDFNDNSMVIDAVIRNFEIIGEASNQLSESFKNSHSDIEWYRLSGMRNRIIHGYFGVDLEIVWSIIQNDLGVLKDRISILINLQ